MNEVSASPYLDKTRRIVRAEPTVERIALFNLVKTAMLLAAMTALFMGVGYMIGGETGMMHRFLSSRWA